MQDMQKSFLWIQKILTADHFDEAALKATATEMDKNDETAKRGMVSCL